MLRIVLFSIALLCALAPVAARADRVHRVQAGQTLSHVARKHGVSVYDLLAHNRLRKGAALQPGQVLRVPPKGKVYVRPGQTLSHVARSHRCTIDALARANHMRPDEPLRVGQSLTLPGFAAPRHDRDWGEPAVSGQIVVLGRGGGRTAIQLRDAEGRVSRRGLMSLGALMADGEETVREPHPRLALLLSQLSDHFGGRPLRIVSGFREAGGRTSETSRHVAGRAADVQVAGVPRRTVWEYCRRVQGAGCGYYPNSTFTHVDARRARTQWVDWSQPGRRARYGTLRGPVRNKQRRHRMAYPKAESELPLALAIVEDATGVALSGDSAKVIRVTPFDDRDVDPHGDSDIAEREPPSWARKACLARTRLLVPYTVQRDPRSAL